MKKGSSEFDLSVFFSPHFQFNITLTSSLVFFTLTKTYFLKTCSVSSLMTTTEAIVVELPKDEKEAAPAMGGGMGGMDFS